MKQIYLKYFFSDLYYKVGYFFPSFDLKNTRQNLSGKY